MAMTNNSLAAVVQFQRRMLGQEGGDLGVNGLRQQPPRPGPQHLGQRIVDLIWLAKRDNVILVHGVSLLSQGCGRLQQPPRYATPFEPP
jgi:hypothetical protein